jgi:hypothetical protein
METMSDLEMVVGALIEVLALLIAWAIYPFVVGRKPSRRN